MTAIVSFKMRPMFYRNAFYDEQTHTHTHKRRFLISWLRPSGDITVSSTIKTTVVLNTKTYITATS